MIVHHRKKFLNKGPYHSDANIFTAVYVNRQKDYSSISANLRIKDCSESISLAIDLSKANHFNNTMSKLDILISEIERFREACVLGRERYMEAVEKAEEYKKQQKLKENGKSKRSSSPRKGATRVPVPARDATFQRVRGRIGGNS